MDHKISVKIIAPKGVIFEKEATSLSSQNSRGKFDVLADHANFITFIENSPILVRTLDNKVLTFKFPFAIIYNSNNKVKVYTEIDQELLK